MSAQRNPFRSPRSAFRITGHARWAGPLGAFIIFAGGVISASATAQSPCGPFHNSDYASVENLTPAADNGSKRDGFQRVDDMMRRVEIARQNMLGTVVEMERSELARREKIAAEKTDRERAAARHDAARTSEATTRQHYDGKSEASHIAAEQAQQLAVAEAAHRALVERNRRNAEAQAAQIKAAEEQHRAAVSAAARKAKTERVRRWIANVKARRFMAKATELQRRKTEAARKASADRQQSEAERAAKAKTEAAERQSATSISTDPSSAAPLSDARSGSPRITITTKHAVVRSAEVTQLSSAAAKRRLDNGFEIITSRISGDIEQAWRRSSRTIPAERIAYKRVKRNWFAVSWTNEDFSHYLFGLPGDDEVGMVHIKSPLDGRKTLTAQNQELVASIACSTYFGDRALPCARRR